ncbi:MAG: response regulator [Bacteroidota bacterium]|nr:response regulator [Bacteroidota bacterium]
MSEHQKNISDFLRLADKEIKNANLEIAMAYINKIFALEAKNVYAKAYRERIISLLEAKGILRIDAEQIVLEAKLTEPVPAPTKEIPKPITEGPNDTTADIETVPTKWKWVKQEQQQTTKPATPSKHHLIKRSAVASEAYKTLLMEIWSDGAITHDEQSRVESMRETFAITQDEHATIEKDVRLTSYLNSIKSEWRQGVTNFESLRKKFLITEQEQVVLEPKVFQLLQSLQSNGSILILDDEIPFLTLIKGLLSEGGYYCFTATTAEEGLQLLDTMTPDIVICDINFTKPNMSGFAFYEKFRSIDKFIATPFIFLSALDQDVLIRTGKKLGADDYLLKPIDTEMLLATVEGKLRRSRELRREN